MPLSAWIILNGVRLKRSFAFQEMVAGDFGAHTPSTLAGKLQETIAMLGRQDQELVLLEPCQYLGKIVREGRIFLIIAGFQGFMFAKVCTSVSYTSCKLGLNHLKKGFFRTSSRFTESQEIQEVIYENRVMKSKCGVYFPADCREKDGR